MIPWVYVVELLQTRTYASGDRKAAVFVPDDLFWAYRDGVGSGGYTAMEHASPNILFNGVVIRPETSQRTCGECGAVRS